MRNVAAAAAVIALGNVVSRLLGLVREQVMAALFGATGATDAFVAASAVPQMVYDLLVGGAISAALVPVFVDLADDDERLARVLSALLTLVALALVGVALVLGVFAPSLVDVLLAGRPEDQQAEAATMVRVMLAAVVLQGVAGVLMAVLYARRRNALPAFAAAVYNGGIIVGALALHGALGVYALVVGVLIGAAGQVVLQLPGLRGLRLRPRLDLDGPEPRAILRLYLPVMAGMVVTIVGIVIDRNLASRLAEGSLSVMSYATRLIQFPLGLVGTAASLAVLAPLAKHASALALAPASADASAADRRAYRDTLVFGIRLVLLLMVPATVGLMVLAEPIVRLLFQYGRFGAAETERTALVFLAYAPQLPFTALDQLFIVAFYARKDTRTPVLVGVATVGLYVVAALALIGPLEVAGLALANAVQNGAHGLILLVLLERAGTGLLTAELGGFLGRVALASGAMGAMLWVGTGSLIAATSSAAELALALAILGVLAGVAYVGGLELLGVRDGRAVGATVLARVRGRPPAR